jgi:S1-C subfamily serine protease
MSSTTLRRWQAVAVTVAAVAPLATGASAFGSDNSAGEFHLSTVTKRVRPAVVSITAKSAFERGRTAATGLVISSSGLVLTTNSAIADGRAFKVLVGAGRSAIAAAVVGYDVADDVALLRVAHVSDFDHVSIGDPSSVAEGEPVAVIGNAGGRNATPKAVAGHVVSLDATVPPASDGSRPERVGLIAVAAALEPGSAGSAVAGADGRVIAMLGALASASGANEPSSRGFAIPIDRALAIAHDIDAGRGSTRVHIGGSRALLGIRLAATDPTVSEVGAGSSAERAGIAAGDTIVSVDGNTVHTAAELAARIDRYQPHDSIAVVWRDASGREHRAKIELTKGPPA